MMTEDDVLELKKQYIFSKMLIARKMLESGNPDEVRRGHAECKWLIEEAEELAHGPESECKRCGEVSRMKPGSNCPSCGAVSVTP